MTTRIDINGFGRIGRNFSRAALEQGADIETVAVNDLTDNKTLACLLKYDSITGRFQGEISYDDEGIIVNGKHIKVLAQRNPADLPRGRLSVEVIVGSTGLFTDGGKAKAHLDGGAKKVVISVPAKNVGGTFAMDMNEADYDNVTMNIVPNASCATNCLAPLVKVLEKNLGTERGIMITIHSYTGSQHVLDASHSNLRCARTAVLSIALTKTGVAQVIALVLSVLEGKLDDLVVRAPTPTGSLIDLIFITKNEVPVGAVKAVIKAAAEGRLKGILKYAEDSIVSSDIVGNPHALISGATKTKVIGNLVKVPPWYDDGQDYLNALVHLTALVSSELA